MHRELAIVFTFTIAALAGSVGLTRASEEAAHLHVRLKPCDFLQHAILRGTYKFHRVDGPGSLRGDFTWDYNRDKTVAFDLDVPAGFYTYEVRLIDGDDRTHTPSPSCANRGYIGLLPGHNRTTGGDMDGEEHLVPPLLLMGTLPSGYSVTLVRYAREIVCGESVTGVQTVAVRRFETEDGAYYLYDVGGGKDVQFGLTVTSPNGRSVTFAIEATYPASGPLNGPPAYSRYDVSTDLFERALAHTPVGNAVCIGTPTT